MYRSSSALLKFHLSNFSYMNIHSFQGLGQGWDHSTYIGDTTSQTSKGPPLMASGRR